MSFAALEMSAHPDNTSAANDHAADNGVYAGLTGCASR
jgi:hypothetical protein